MKKLLFLIMGIAVAATALSFTSCKEKSAEDIVTPVPGAGVMGDWITAPGVDYTNLIFTSQYSYIFTVFNKTEVGFYTVNIKAGTITLIPDLDGAATRTLKYTRTAATLTILKGSVLMNAAMALDKDLMLSIQ